MRTRDPTHTSKTPETLETDDCNMRFQAQHLLVAWTNTTTNMWLFDVFSMTTCDNVIISSGL